MADVIYGITIIVRFFQILIFIRIILSWLPIDTKNNDFVEYVYSITEPILKIFRSILPPIAGLDLSPIIACFAIDLIGNALIRLLII
ncbi:YggT family protein [bacterium]|nr:YggT family protein [bacterium]